jgi:N-methylhydantoinase B/oxoprolinase/acetone carboxylase alpha subunit
MSHAAEPVDQITMQVINNYLVTTAREMGVAMMNTSYSPLFNEGLDFSCAIFDGQGEMIAQAEFCPAHLGAIIFIAEWTIQEVGLENFQPGDVIIHNDPFRGGCHIPEFCVIKPVFYQHQIVAFLCCIGHMTEVGGMVPGGFAGDATEVFQEGIRLPPVKIVEGGHDRDDIWNIILSNIRTPKYGYGDLKAMIGSLYVGESRVLELLERYGLATYNSMKEAIKNYSERRMREEIRVMPDGSYSYEGYAIDNDGVIDAPIRLRVTVIIDGDEMIVDYSGSAKQARGPVNCTYGVTASATYNALLHLTDNDIPSNHGCYRPITILAPPGTIVNVEYPGASVGGNSEIHPHLVMAIYAAVKDVLPDRISAFDGGTSELLAIGGVHPDTGELFANLSNEGCGWGGRPTKDGNDVLCIPNGNCAIAPIEILEARYPLLHRQFALHEGSGGAGKNRGGLGCIREIEILADEIRVSAFIERNVIQPEGFFGGQPGKNSAFLVRRGGGSDYQTMKEAFGTRCNGKFSDIYMLKGDLIRLVTSGGGGYGNALEREFERIEHDLREGYLSREQAIAEYRVVFGEDGLIDLQATERLRASSV